MSNQARGLANTIREISKLETSSHEDNAENLVHVGSFCSNPLFPKSIGPPQLQLLPATCLNAGIDILNKNLKINDLDYH